MLENRGTVIQGDGKEAVSQVLDHMLMHGFGRIEIILRDHKVASIDYTKKLVRAPLQIPRRARA